MTFEARLADAFERYLAPAPVVVDARALADQAARTVETRPASWIRLRRAWSWRLVLVGTVILALVVAGGILVGDALNQLQPSIPTPTLGPSPVAAETAAPWNSRGFAAVVMRPVPGAEGLSVNVLAVLPDGREHLIQRVDPADVDGLNLAASGTINDSGWLAVFGSDPGSSRVALLNLGDLAIKPVIIEAGSGPSTAWSGDGLFAYPDPNGIANWSMLVIDPRTGKTYSLPGLRIPGGGPTTQWAADGSGLLVGLSTDGSRPAYGIAPFDGGPVVPGTPRLDARGPRLIAEGGSTLAWSSGTGVIVFDPNGGPAKTWYVDELAPATLVGESFSEDGHSIWLLLDRVTDGIHTAVLARQSAPGLVDVIATLPLDAATEGLGGLVLSPDDSMFVFWTSTGSKVAGVGRSFAADLAGSPAGYMAGPEISDWFGAP